MTSINALHSQAVRFFPQQPHQCTSPCPLPNQDILLDPSRLPPTGSPVSTPLAQPSGETLRNLCAGDVARLAPSVVPAFDATPVARVAYIDPRALDVTSLGGHAVIEDDVFATFADAAMSRNVLDPTLPSRTRSQTPTDARTPTLDAPMMQVISDAEFALLLTSPEPEARTRKVPKTTPKAARAAKAPKASNNPSGHRGRVAAPDGEARPFSCPPGHCTPQWFFKRAEHLRRHMRRKANDIPCEFAGCNLKFSRKDNMRQHEKRHHRQSDTVRS